MRGQHSRGRRPHALPAAGRQRTGDAQDGANGAALSEAGPGKTGARTRARRFPPPSPPPPPPAPLTRRRPTGPRPTPTAAQQPPRHEYTPGGARRGQQKAGRRLTGRGGGGAAPPPPAPPHPPQVREPQERPSAPPEPRGRPPPRRDRDAGGGGGGRGWICSRGGRGRGASPHQRVGATRATEQYGGRAPHDPPVTTAHSGRAEGGFRSAGAPRGAVHGPPLTTPPARGGTATPTARARRKGVRRRHKGGQD